MTMKLANGLRDPILDAVSTALDGGVIEIYSGPQPVAANDAPTGTLLLGIFLPDPNELTAEDREIMAREQAEADAQ